MLHDIPYLLTNTVRLSPKKLFIPLWIALIKAQDVLTRDFLSGHLKGFVAQDDPWKCSSMMFTCRFFWSSEPTEVQACLVPSWFLLSKYSLLRWSSFVIPALVLSKVSSLWRDIGAVGNNNPANDGQAYSMGWLPSEQRFERNITSLVWPLSEHWSRILSQSPSVHVSQMPSSHFSEPT